MIKIEDLERQNFKPYEFISSVKGKLYKINNEPNQSQLVAGMVLADKMQEISDKLSKKFGYRVIIDITSGFRSLLLNKEVGGSPDSWHMQFLACDFNVRGMQPHEVVLAIKECGISIDKCFVEGKCVHMQTAMNDSKNRNFFGSAYQVNGEWKVINEIKKV